MTRFALAALLCLHAAAASAQGAQSAEISSLRRALQVDPFASAPYRLLTNGLRPADRKLLIDELSRGTAFADKVLVARLQIDAGQTAAARAALHDAAALLPAESRALDSFGQIALSTGAFADASIAARRGLERGRTPQRLVTAAVAELRQAHRKEGLALLAEARALDPSGGAADAALDTLLGQRMPAEAAELLRAQLDPQDGRAAAAGTSTQWRRLADLERQLGRSNEAAAALLHALDAESLPTGRRATSQAILRQYRDRKALPELVKSLKTAKTAARLVLRGDVEAELGHAPAAAASWAQAAVADPNDPDPQLRLAAAAKTPTERATRYEALVAAHPGELRFALELASLRFAAKDDAGGKRALHEAAARFATAPSAQDQIARKLTERHDLEGALQCRKRAADLEQRNADYAIALGDAYQTLGKRPDAVAAYFDAIARAGSGRSAYDRALDALERAGYDAEADTKFLEARAKWPGDLGLIRRHAATLERRGELPRALETWRDCGKKATRTFEREQAAYNVKRIEQAVMELRGK